MAVSQNGWPVYTSMTDDRMHLWVVPGTERKFRLRFGSAGFLLCHFIRWGGDYEGRKDEMHFEINRSLSICEKLARQLTRTPRGKKILEANPGQREIIFS
jgi:hypothetical protein